MLSVHSFGREVFTFESKDLMVRTHPPQVVPAPVSLQIAATLHLLLLEGVASSTAFTMSTSLTALQRQAIISLISVHREVVVFN